MKNPTSSKWAEIALESLIYESYLAKSAIARYASAATVAESHYAISLILISSIVLAGIRTNRGGMWTKPNKPVAFAGGSVIVWLFISALNQDALYENCFAVLILGLFAYAAVISLPGLLGLNYSLILYRSVLRVSKVATVLSIALVIVPITPAFVTGRLQGALLDSAVAPGVFLVAAIIFLMEWLRQGRVLGSVTWFIAASALVVLARSRGTTGALVLSCGCIILFVREPGKQIKRVMAAATVMVLVVGLLATWTQAGENNRTDVMRFLRLDSGDVLDTRESHWKDGLARIDSSKVFGLGILAKFTSKGSIAGQMESGSSGYDVSMDPHNALINIGQAAGYPAIFLLALFMAMVIVKGGRLAYANKCARSSELMFCNAIVLVYCGASFVSPEFLSFGSLSDRIFYLCVGSAFAASSEARGRGRWVAGTPLPVH